MEIRDKIDPVLNSTVSKEDMKKDEKKEESKSRWEKEAKEIKEGPIEVDAGEDKADSK